MRRRLLQPAGRLSVTWGGKSGDLLRSDNYSERTYSMSRSAARAFANLFSPTEAVTNDVRLRLVVADSSESGDRRHKEKGRQRPVIDRFADDLWRSSSGSPPRRETRTYQASRQSTCLDRTPEEIKLALLDHPQYQRLGESQQLVAAEGIEPPTRGL